MADETKRRDQSPADEAELTGEERWERDADARDIEHQLSPEEQAARQTHMRRRIEAGESDDEAWAHAVEDVRERRVSIAREGEEGSERGASPVQARKRANWRAADTVEDEEAP